MTGTPDWLGPVLAQLGISIVFILAWQNERTERQKITADKDKAIAQITADKDKAIAEMTMQMMQMQTQHRAEMMELLHNMTVPRYNPVPVAPTIQQAA